MTGVCAAFLLTFGRYHLPGIQDPVRIEQLLDAAHERDAVAVLALEVGELAEADAMLARARPTACEGVVDDSRVQRFCPLDRRAVFRVEQERDMEVPVADMTDDPAEQTRLVERPPGV